MDRTGRRPPRAGPLPVAARPGTPLPGRRCRLTRNPPHQTSPPKGIAMKALITAYVRSPFHFARKGALADMRPDTLAAQVVTGLLQRTGIDPATLEDVITGCAYPEAAQGNNIAHIVSLLAGLPQELGGMTVNRFCGSSMSAIHIAAAQIEAGLGEAYLCIGVESMTMVPQGGFNFSPHPALYEHSDAYISMGETAENVAQRYAVTRADQEALAVASHRKAAAARDAGRLQAEIVPITPASGDMVAQDGCIRPGTHPGYGDCGRRPRLHGHGPGARYAQGTRARRHCSARSGCGGNQRSVWITGPGLHPRTGPARGRDQPGRWRPGHRPSAGRHRCAHHRQGG